MGYFSDKHLVSDEITSGERMGFWARILDTQAEEILRAADTALALIFLWLLIISITASRLCGRRGFQWNKRERPGAYWAGIFLLALMVLHFGGLAWVGQKLG